MFDSLRDDEGVPLDEVDQCFGSVAVTDRDVEDSVDDQEELVGVVVAMPHVVAQGACNPYVVVVHASDDARAVHLIEAVESFREIDDLRWFHASKSGPERRDRLVR